MLPGITAEIAGSKQWCVQISHFSHVQLFVTLWTVAHQAPLSLEFSRQEYRSGLPHPPPGDFPNQTIAPASLTSPALASRFFTTSVTWEAKHTHPFPHISCGWHPFTQGAVFHHPSQVQVLQTRLCKCGLSVTAS